MTADEENSFEEAYTRLSRYNQMPEEEGVLPVLRFGMEERYFVQTFWDVERGRTTWAGLSEVSAREALRGNVWLPLRLDFVSSGLAGYILDLGYRASPSTVRVWLKLLAHELPSHPVGDETWNRIKAKLSEPEVVTALSTYYIRRMQSSHLWQERKQRWVNRNTQAMRAALKQLASKS